MDFSEVWRVYQEELASRNDSDYAIDEVQFTKLLRAYEFFSEIAKRDNGELEDVNLQPRMVNGGITAYFTVFYISGDELRAFSEIVGTMSGFSIDTTLDGRACISFTIPGVFKKIK